MRLQTSRLTHLKLGSIWQKNSDNYSHSSYCREFGSLFLQITEPVTLFSKMGLGEKYFLTCHFHVAALLAEECLAFPGIDSYAGLIDFFLHMSRDSLFRPREGSSEH